MWLLVTVKDLILAASLITRKSRTVIVIQLSDAIRLIHIGLKLTLLITSTHIHHVLVGLCVVVLGILQ